MELGSLVNGLWYYNNYNFATRTPPVVTTGSATNIMAFNANLNGTVNPVGLATTAYFEYGTTMAYGTVTATQDAGNGSTAVTKTATLSGLAASTTYHYRLVATNTAGTTQGADQPFTTDAAPVTSPPVVTTLDASNITISGATLNGAVTPNGTATSVHFEYGISTAYGTSTADVSVGGGLSGQSLNGVPIFGLIANTTYHYRLVASNSAGISQGQDLTFVTLATPGGGGGTGTDGVPQITALTFSNFPSSTVTGVTGDGTVVVGTEFDDSADAYQAFTAVFSGSGWIASPYGPLTGDTVSAGTAISYDGFAYAGYGTSDAILVDGSAAQDLKPLAGDDQCAAYGLTAAGTYVVGVSTQLGIGGGTTQAVRWGNASGGSTPVDLGTLSGFDDSVAYGVALLPFRIVGYCTQYSGYDVVDQRATLWDGSNIESLGYPAGYEGSLAVAISEDGSTVVGASGAGNILASGLGSSFIGTSGRFNGDSTACYWKPDVDVSSVYPLTRPDADNYSIATAVSTDGGYIVGSSGTYSPGDYASAAILWAVVENQSFTLLTLLQNVGADLTGWSSLLEATGVSGDGDVIVGYGIYEGRETGFRVSGVRKALPALPGAVAITTGPQSQSVVAGGNVTLNVVATGTAPLSYQWTKDGVVIPGATTSTLQLFNLQDANAGNYTVTVSGPVGATVSATAVLTVTSAATPTPTPMPSLPMVTIAAKTTKLAENGGKDKLIVTRTGDTSSALTVAYSAKGSAQAGVNYKRLSGSVVIPAGSASAAINLKPLDDGVADGTLVLKLVIQPGNGYTVGAPGNLKIKILNVD